MAKLRLPEAVSAPSASGPDARGVPETFVPVDLCHMTQLWGSESTVKALLRFTFVSSVRDNVRSIAAATQGAIEVERALSGIIG